MRMLENSLSEKNDGDNGFDEAIELMRLLLVAQLLENTGVPWTVVVIDKLRYDVLLECRWGRGEYQFFHLNIDLTEASKHFEDWMKSEALKVVVSYGRRIARGAEAMLDG